MPPLMAREYNLPAMPRGSGGSRTPMAGFGQSRRGHYPLRANDGRDGSPGRFHRGGRLFCAFARSACAEGGMESRVGHSGRVKS
jgi:hypothetical protein